MTSAELDAVAGIVTIALICIAIACVLAVYCVRLYRTSRARLTMARVYEMQQRDLVKRLNDAIYGEWNWPEFPVRVAEFIESGQWH